MENKKKIEMILAGMFLILVLILILAFFPSGSHHEKRLSRIHYETESIKILNEDYFLYGEKTNYELFYGGTHLIKEYEKKMVVSPDYVFIQERSLYDEEFSRY